MTLTVDANIWVGALDISDPTSAVCRACLLGAAERSLRLYSPLLLPIEVAATIARKTRDARQGKKAAEWVRAFPGHIWHPLSESCATTAEQMASTLFLRGADAIYVAVSHLSGSVLLTYDAEVIARAGKVSRVMSPDSWLKRACGKRR
jgi:predicted nucleic acid-binding protein